jgi:MoaA/NifB/PqqE/SkfB family radical SAM enzyme
VNKRLALSRRQRERLAGYLERRPRLGPETVHIDITNACNLDCVTCWNYAPGLKNPKNAAWRTQRMEATTFRRVLDEVAAAGAERIILSGGGEPFTHPDIADFIAAVKGRGLALTIITNGTLCDFAQLADAGVDQLLVNVSAADAATYAAYHPNQPEATFDRLTESIAAVAGRVAVNLVQVINALNAAELPQMVELAHWVAARCSFKLGDTPPGTEGCVLDSEQRQVLLAAEVPRALALARTLGVKHNLEAFAAQLAGGEPSAGALACFAGYLYSRVYVDGRVFFCCEHIEVGHIADGSFATLWVGADYDAVRQRLHRGEGYLGCARCGKHDMNFTAARQLAAMGAAEEAI